MSGYMPTEAQVEAAFVFFYSGDAEGNEDTPTASEERREWRRHFRAWKAQNDREVTARALREVEKQATERAAAKEILDEHLRSLTHNGKRPERASQCRCLACDIGRALGIIEEGR